MPEVIPFLSRHPEGRQLSNFFQVALTWMGVVFTLGSEQAYVYAKVLMCVPPSAARSFLSEILSAATPLHCKQIGSRIGKLFIKKGSKIEQKWDSVKEHVMFSILWHKFSQNPGLRNYLVGTGDKILVEANPLDSYWGAGLDKNEILRRANRGPDWVPSPQTNMLGKLLMKLRTWLQSDIFPGEPVFYLGDSILQEVPVGPKISWGGGNLSQILQLLQMVWVPGYKIIVLHAGTNNLTQFKPWDPRFKAMKDLETGEARVWTASKIWRGFLEDYIKFRQLFSGYPGDVPKIIFSEILPRHDIPPGPKAIFEKPGTPFSKASRAAFRVNEHA